MKNSKRLLAVSIASACAALPFSAFATNGDVLIGLGAQSRALGGTGTAAYYGSENALTNPALLGKTQGTEFAIGGTIFMPDVKAAATTSGPTSANSKADTNIIPEVSMSHRINDHLTFGLGMYGSAGMGVDYRDDPQLFDAYTNLQLMKFAPTLAYNKDAFGFGVAPVIQYGALSINYNTGSANVGRGVSTDLGTGFNIGGYYDVSNQLTVAASYQSSIDMKYKYQITDAANNFGIGAGGTNTITSDHLEQPAEMSLGVAYTMNNWLLTADAKQIQWSSAKGYKDFNWKDQSVFGIGAKYTSGNYWVGAGYNRGDDPIKKLSATNYPNEAINVFNNLFFPGIVQDHITLGGGVALSKNTTIEGAVVMASKVSKQVDTSIITGAFGGSGTTYEKTTHSQIGYTISVRMNF